MHTVASESLRESLLDEADFLAELSSLEHGLAEKPRPQATLLELSTPVRTEAPGKFVEDVRPVASARRVEDEDGSPVVGRLAAAGMFVLMIGVGAAGAMLVYHERVARILATFM